MNNSIRKKSLFAAVSFVVIACIIAYFNAPILSAVDGESFASTTSDQVSTGGGQKAGPASEAAPAAGDNNSNLILATSTISDSSQVQPAGTGTAAEDVPYTEGGASTDGDEILPDSESALILNGTSDSQNQETVSTSSPLTINFEEGDPSALNSDTGADSVNISETTVSNSTTVESENRAVTINESFLRADTGKNLANYNTGSGIITTQKAEGDGQIINVINLSKVNAGKADIGPINAGNENTGENSGNQAKVNINSQLTVHISNDSETVNEVEAEVNSGENQSNYNTGHGIILTGDASLGLNFITMANANLIGVNKFYANWQNVYTDYAGNIDLSKEAAAPLSGLSDMIINASNKSTGENSSNEAIVNVNDQTEIITSNKGKISNKIKAKVTSGKNKSNQNTGTGSVATGKVNSSINAVNFLNSNVISSNWWLKTLNIFGNWQGDIILPSMPKPNLALGRFNLSESNENTGAGSNNEASVNIDNTLGIENSNEAVIDNKLSLKTNTGNNETSYNVGSGIVKFGKADAETNELNIANVNVSGDSWWMVVVNKFGQWAGTTIGAGVDVDVNGSGNTTLLTPKDSGIKVENSSTGPDSNNIAGANISHSTDISNSNDADILNDINVEAVSGENEAQRNTGHGYIDTGDIRATNNIINFANANIAVGNWLVTVVNVFGDWAGNLIFNSTVATTGSGSGMSQPNGSLSGNTGTGSGANNSASSSSSTSNNISGQNSSDLSNTTQATSLTGENSASYNTGSGIIATGAANTYSGLSNQVNTNNVSVGTGGGGNLTGINTATGANSDNQTVVTTDNTNNINSSNNAAVNNAFTAYNSTGQNSSNYNTGAGLIDTGWAQTFLELYNKNNENKITLGQLLDELSGNAENAEDAENAENVENAENNYNNSNGQSQNMGGGGSGGGSSESGGGSSGGGGSGGLGMSNTTKALIKGDINGDGQVNDFDFSLLMANWGVYFRNFKADLNADNKVNEGDLTFVLSNWYMRKTN